jgi:CRP-like cAMP-binding protein
LQFDEGRSLFIVREGPLEVSVRTEDGEKSVARRYPGDDVGEHPLLTGATPNATIAAFFRR